MVAFRGALLASFVACLLSSALCMPFLPDPEDDVNENELNAGKFEENAEDILNDEELVKVLDDDDDEEEMNDDDEEMINPEEDDDDKDETEEDDEKDIEEAEAEEVAKDLEEDDDDDEEDKDDDDKDDDDDDDDKVGDEPIGDMDETEVKKPGFMSYMYQRAKNFLKGLGKK